MRELGDRTYRLLVVSLLLISLVVLGMVGEAVAIELDEDQLDSDQLVDSLTARFVREERAPEPLSKAEKLHAGEVMELFYREREHEPLWVDDSGLSERGQQLFALLSSADEEGLDPDDYHLNTMNGIWMALGRGGEVEELLLDLEVLLTDGLLVYATDLKFGRLDSEDLERRWIEVASYEALVQELERVVEYEDPSKAAVELRPTHNAYDDLQEVRGAYSDLRRKELVTLSGTERLSRGDRGQMVAELRERLDQEPGMEVAVPGEKGAEYFDHGLEEELSDFQRQRGLSETGVFDSATRRALNLSPEEILRKIDINMERWRWLPSDLGERYVLVNLPDFRLQVVEEKEVVMGMEAVIGQRQRQTPVFSSGITNLVFNPRWYMPRSIAVRDHLPHVQADVNYLEENHIRVYERIDREFREADPEEIDWEAKNEDNFPYYFWMDAGPWNPLGDVVIRFPNPYQVYLHDTPDKDLFGESSRLFSSGCIRLEKPMELVRYLIADMDWDEERIEEALELEREKRVLLSEPVPIHVTYMTAWVDEEGRLNLRSDIYGRDREVEQALF